MGNALPGPTGWMIAFGVLALTAILLAWALRRRSRRSGRHGSGQGHRLSIVETREIDDQRRLLIVRCDGADHLVLVGGGSDVLLKADLSIPETRAGFPSPIVDEPKLDAAPFVDMSPRPEPRRAEAPSRTDRFEMPVPPLAGRPEVAAPTIPVGVETFMPPRTAARTAPNVMPPAPPQQTEPRVDMPTREIRQPAPPTVPTPAPEPVSEPAAIVTSPPPAASEADFSEMTRKLEEALKRTASMRPPAAAPAQSVPVDPVAAVPEPRAAEASTPVEGEQAGGDDAGLTRAGDPFEEEIRRLLGRDKPKT